jgi:hypothetical protein
MGLLTPLFLAGLAALAVPVIIHLIQRERKEPVAFPSLMFLRQVPYRSTRRRRIRNLPLFVVRCLALVLFALAFARPFVERDLQAAGASGEARELVVLLDRSYSMGYGDRWARAVSAARDAIVSAGPEDRLSLVFFDAAAVPVAPPATDRTRLLATLDTATPGPHVTRYAPALQVAQAILSAAERPRAEAVLISDFQQVGWDGAGLTRLPAGAVLTPVAITDAAVSNVTVTGVTFRRETVSGRDRVTVTARLASVGAEPVQGRSVVLELDGREVQRQAVDIDANGAATLDFAPVTLADGVTRGTVRSAPDALPADDAYHFVLSPGQAVSVLLVEGARAHAGLYLRRALAIGRDPGFRVETRRAADLTAADLAGRDVVILNDVPFPGGDAARRLRSFIEAGGGLIVAAAERSGGWVEAGDVLPVAGTGRVDREAGGALGYIDYGHPVFDVFEGPRSGSLTGARFFRYRALGAPAAGDAVLARFDDGAPALIERRLGAGRVLVWASSLDTEWNDLPLQPVFLPVVHRLVLHASGHAEPSPAFTVGQVLNVARAHRGGPAAGDTAATATAAAAGVERVVIAPDGARAALGGDGLLRLELPGFYEVRPARGAGPGIAVAANVDRAESDLTPMPVEPLVAATAPLAGGAEVSGGAAAAVPASDRERRQALWWYLLLAALLLLAGETVLANRRPRAAAAP